MHGVMYQIVNYKDEALDIDNAAELVTNYADYIDELDPGYEAEHIENLLKSYQENGCEVNLEEKTFKIVDKEKFLGYLLGFELPGKIETFEETFQYLNSISEFDLLLFNGSVYRSYIDAFAIELFDWNNKYNADDKVFYVTNAWDYHF